MDNFKRLLNDFVNDGGMWDEEIYEYDREGDYDFRNLLRELIDPYVIAQIDTSSDAGQISVADRAKVMKALGL